MALLVFVLVLASSSLFQPADAWQLPPLPTLGSARTRLPPVVICPGICPDRSTPASRYVSDVTTSPATSRPSPDFIHNNHPKALAMTRWTT